VRKSLVLFSPKVWTLLSLCGIVLCYRRYNEMNVITYLARSLFKKRTVDEVLRNQRFLRKDVGKTQVALRCDKKVAPFHKPILACGL